MLAPLSVVSRPPTNKYQSPDSTAEQCEKLATLCERHANALQHNHDAAQRKAYGLARVWFIKNDSGYYGCVKIGNVPVVIVNDTTKMTEKNCYVMHPKRLALASWYSEIAIEMRKGLHNAAVEAAQAKNSEIAKGRKRKAKPSDDEGDELPKTATVAEPVSEPVAEPVSEPVAEPVSEPVAEPVSEVPAEAIAAIESAAEADKGDPLEVPAFLKRK